MTRRVVIIVVVLVALVGGAGIWFVACSSSSTGSVALAVDPAGRLVAVVAVCEGQHLGWLTLTDETSGTSTTARPKDTPAFGGTLLLTAPVAEPRLEGVLDLLDSNHDYRLTGSTAAEPGSDKSTGELEGVRFRLDAAIREKALREGSVLARGPKSLDGVVVGRDAFLRTARDRC
jgi:hypothetical protein